MTDSLNAAPTAILPGDGPRLTTPAGLQANADLARRRALVLGLNVLTYAALLWAGAAVLQAGGWTIVDTIMFACFMVGSPWSVLGFWNACIGLWLLHFHKAPTA